MGKKKVLPLLTLPSEILLKQSNYNKSYRQHRNCVKRHRLSHHVVHRVVLCMKSQVESICRKDWISAERVGHQLQSIKSHSKARRKRYERFENKYTKQQTSFSGVKQLILLIPSLKLIASPFTMSLPIILFDYITVKHWLPLLEPQHLCSLLEAISSVIFFAEVHHNRYFPNALPGNGMHLRHKCCPRMNNNTMLRLNAIADLVASKQRYFTPTQFSQVLRLFNNIGFLPPALKFNSVVHLMANAFRAPLSMSYAKGIIALNSYSYEKKVTTDLESSPAVLLESATDPDHERDDASSCSTSQLPNNTTVFLQHPLTILAPFLYLLQSSDYRVSELILLRIVVGLYKNEPLTFQSTLEILSGIEYLHCRPRLPSELWPIKLPYACSSSAIPSCTMQTCSNLNSHRSHLLIIFRFLARRILTNDITANYGVSMYQLNEHSLMLFCVIKLLNLSSSFSLPQYQSQIERHLLSLLSKYRPFISRFPLLQKHQLLSLLAIVASIKSTISIPLPSAFLSYWEPQLYAALNGSNRLIAARVILSLGSSNEQLLRHTHNIIKCHDPNCESVATEELQELESKIEFFTRSTHVQIR